MHILIVGLLILLNGLLSMSEFAIISSRRSRLRERADDGSTGARVALELVDRPNRFLSTVQVGITLVGILAGAFGGARIAEDLAVVLQGWEFVAQHAHTVALVIVVSVTTYLTLVVGELVPKRVAIQSPEKIAALISRPMRAFSTVTLPVVLFLTASTRVVMRLLGRSTQPKEEVSEEEVQLLLKEGRESGVFRRAEAEMVAGVFRLDDVRADAVMTPRVDVVWMNADASPQEVLARIERSGHTRYPVCDGELDKVIGCVSTTRIATAVLRGEGVKLRELAEPVHIVPESADAARVLEHVTRTGDRFMVVLSEHGGVDGVLTVHDLSEAVLGDLGQPDARQLEDGTWVIAGAMPVEEAEALLDVSGMREAHAKSYGTIAGFVMRQLGRIPARGDELTWQGLRFRVSRMSRHRIREVRVERVERAEEPAR